MKSSPTSGIDAYHGFGCKQRSQYSPIGQSMLFSSGSRRTAGSMTRRTNNPATPTIAKAAVTRGDSSLTQINVMAWSPDHAIGWTEGLPFFVETFGRARVAVGRPRHNGMLRRPDFFTPAFHLRGGVAGVHDE